MKTGSLIFNLVTGTLVLILNTGMIQRKTTCRSSGFNTIICMEGQ